MEMYNVIESFEPGVIIDISQAGMIVSAALFQHGFNIIHFALSGFSSGAVFDRYIAKDKELCRLDNMIYDSIEEEKIIEAPIVIPYTLESNKVYSRQEYGIKKSDFVMITVGNRLIYELDDSFLINIKELLRSNSQIRWIVVGNNLGEHFLNEMSYYIDNGQVIAWGFEDDLVALYRLCDVYINPERMGGGGSIVMAMKMGMPVAMTKKATDITAVIGLKNCVEDYADMMRYIVELVNSEELRKRKSDVMLQMVNREEISFKGFADRIVMAYKDIMKEECRNEI